MRAFTDLIGSPNEDQISLPQQQWGLKVLERLPLHGDETVLDAGCGSGRLSEQVLERLPRGRLIAMDNSANMLRALRRSRNRACRANFGSADRQVQVGAERGCTRRSLERQAERTLGRTRR